MGLVKRIAVVATALVLSIGMVACGNTQQSSTPGPTVAPQEISPAPESIVPDETPSPSGGETARIADSGGVVKYGVLNGPTGLGAIGLHKQNGEGNTANGYEFVFAGAPDEMVGKLTSGEMDLAALPTNLAATLYNKTDGDIVQLSNITLGVLYILENGNTINTIEDLRGKTIYATGQGSNPEYVLNYILKQAGIADEVTVEFKSEHSELAALMASGDVEIAMLPEPFVTSVTSGNEDIRVALSVNEEWEKACDQAGIKDSQLVMSSIVARKEFVENNPELIKIFLDEYKASVDYVNNNPAEAAAYMEQQNILGMKAAVAEKAIPNCSMVFITSDEMKTMTTNYLTILMEANPQSIGGKLPGDDFYHAQ